MLPAAATHLPRGQPGSGVAGLLVGGGWAGSAGLCTLAYPTPPQDTPLAQGPVSKEDLPCGRQHSASPLRSRIEDDGLPVISAAIEAGAGFQVGRRSESGHPVRHCPIPAKFCEAAEHSVRYLPAVSPPTHLDSVQTGSRRCHGHEAVLLDDRLAPEYDLHRIAESKINFCQPDPVAMRMVPDLDDLADDDALCLHSPRTLPRWDTHRPQRAPASS